MNDNTVQHTGIMLFNDIFDDNKGKLIGELYVIEFGDVTVTITDDCAYWLYDGATMGPQFMFESFAEYKAMMDIFASLYGNEATNEH